MMARVRQTIGLRQSLGLSIESLSIGPVCKDSLIASDSLAHTVANLPFRHSQDRCGLRCLVAAKERLKTLPDGFGERLRARIEAGHPVLRAVVVERILPAVKFCVSTVYESNRRSTEL
jgi:hypothetical protein